MIGKPRCAVNHRAFVGFLIENDIAQFNILRGNVGDLYNRGVSNGRHHAAAIDLNRNRLAFTQETFSKRNKLIVFELHKGRISASTAELSGLNSKSKAGTFPAILSISSSVAGAVRGIQLKNLVFVNNLAAVSRTESSANLLSGECLKKKIARNGPDNREGVPMQPGQGVP